MRSPFRMRWECALLSLLLLAGWPLGGRAAEAEPLAATEIGPALEALVEADWMAADQRFAAAQSPAGPIRPEGQTTTAQDAAGGCDGVKNGLWGFHVASGEQDPWWQVDLGRAYRLERVVVYNRCGGSEARTNRLRVLVAGADHPTEFRQVYQHDGTPFQGVVKQPLVVRLADQQVTARIVRLQVPGRCSFALDEVEVYGTDEPQTNLALGKPADQISVSRYSRPGTMTDAEYAHYGHQPLVPRPATAGAAPTLFSLAHTRTVVDRGQRLVARLRSLADAARLEPLAAQLAAVDQRLTQLETENQAGEDVRRDLYLAARRVVRQIALTNPRLQIAQLLFLKRHDAGGVFHMCDQFYGCNAKPGGGLYVLRDPFGPNPQLVDVLQHAVVENGRLQGRSLAGGSFLSPELSYDGRTILFAYSQCQAKETYQWAPEFSYHLFKVNADGTGLVQLTDGEWDDFDPCFLPNGRIAFISLRRGGYLRCGRHCPVYTLHSMEADGSDIVCLSYHETHEWGPSVTNDGMLVYSRWDYVDRDTNIAHHIWTSYPDGRDPRTFHGNYPLRRESRPWMEMRIRAIPDSHQFVASTGAHHGHEFGSLVLIDPRKEDDGSMAQLERLTPDVPFPEAEGRPIDRYMIFGTPWPLSLDDYLCVYDAAAKNRGIYWIDRDGNRELVYRDPAISCVSPIPLQPRRRPPLIPDQTTQTAAARRVHGDRPATVAVRNVYDADFAWPAGTKITALRVIQVLPKSTAPPNQPRIGVANQTNARAVLGTVPVEADGSAHFEAPVGKTIYFQALDARGLAIQSMRSATYVHPGEQLTCQGCHERKHRSPFPSAALPLAWRRAPSPIVPDVEGSNPFNYARLVQGVLDRNCVSCHQEKKALDLSGTLDGSFTRSYQNLAGKFGFYYDVGNGSINSGVHGGSRTVAGQFGARAANLLKYLDERHYGVRLTAEDFHRVTLWLDCNSEFLGAYEEVAAQLRGELVRPSLE